MVCPNEYHSEITNKLVNTSDWDLPVFESTREKEFIEIEIIIFDQNEHSEFVLLDDFNYS